MAIAIWRLRKCPFDRVAHPIEIRHDVVVPETQYAEALRFQPLSAGCIVSLMDRMLSAIDFNNESFREANKVDNAGANRSLSAELPSSDLTTLENRPQFPFGIRLIAAQFAG